MKATEFNDKWCAHLEEGHYGMDIDDADIIRYMDEQFTEEVKVNPDFTYSQIKIKWGWSRVYTTSNKNTLWEKEIDKILRYKNKINRFVGS